jgi:predicted transcriptional regulator
MGLKKYLQEENIASGELCKKAGIADSTLSQFINGTRKDIKLSTAVKIAKGLDMSLDELQKIISEGRELNENTCGLH